MTNQVHNKEIKIFIEKFFNGVSPLFFLDAILKKPRTVSGNLWNMFQGEKGEASFDFIRIVDNPESADFLLLPHNYFSFPKHEYEKVGRYLKDLIYLSEKNKKKILIFAMADSDAHIEIPNAIIFRYSQYGYKKRTNEILMPPYPLHFRSKDLFVYRKNMWAHVRPRDKGEKPIVSFCGWAGFPSLYRYITYGIRLFIVDVQTVLGDTHAELHKRGIYFRRKAIRALRNASRVKTNFLIRKAYSAQRIVSGGKEISNEKAEREYIDTIINADFVLAPKGNGNASVRFYEALSLGRFPVLINTDCVLPLEDYIDYSKVMVSVDHSRVSEAEQAIVDFYESMDDSEFKKRQQMARVVFEILRPASFLKIVLSKLKSSK